MSYDPYGAYAPYGSYDSYERDRVDLKELGTKLRANAAEAKKREEGLAIRRERIASSAGVGSGVQAALGANVKRMWYLQRKDAEQEQAGFLAVREAFQNSLDAIRKAIEQGKIKRGRFEVEYKVPSGPESADGTLTIRDNGIGIESAQALKDLYLTLGATGKGAEKRAFGGFGVAKAFILGLVDPAAGGKWRVRTHDLEVNSDMLEAEDPADQEIRMGLEPVKGFEIEFTGLRWRDIGWGFGTRLNYLFGLTETGGEIDVLVNGEKVERPFALTEDKEKEIVTSEKLPDGVRMKVYLEETDQFARLITRWILYIPAEGILRQPAEGALRGGGHGRSDGDADVPEDHYTAFEARPSGDCTRRIHCCLWFFTWAFLVCQNPRMWTLMVWLFQMQIWAPQYMVYAGLVLAALPTLLVFIFC